MLAIQKHLEQTFIPWPSHSNSAPKSVLMFPPLNVQGFKNLLQRPCQWRIEKMFDDVSGIHTLPNIVHEQHCFGLSITTQSAYRLPLSLMLAEHFTERGWLPEHLRDSLETCLHEAMLNALIHGNLEIHSDFKSLSAFQKFYENIHQQMLQSAYAYRYVIIMLTRHQGKLHLFISHEGCGFTRSCPTDTPPSLHGRGLSIISRLSDRLEWIHHGKTLHIEFSL